MKWMLRFWVLALLSFIAYKTFEGAITPIELTVITAVLAAATKVVIDNAGEKDE